MLDKNARLAVIGAGAIGGIVAAHLAREGWDLTLVCKHQEVADLANGPGLRILGVRGAFQQPVRAVANIADLGGPQDLVLLATKATEAIAAARELLPLLHERSLVVSLQNGICEEALASVLGRDRVVGCVVGWGATMLGPGQLEMTSTGEFVLGDLEGRPLPHLEFLANMLGVVVPCRVSANILGELYSKLIVNSCINTLGAISGLYLGQMLAQPQARVIFTAVMREALAVATAMGLKVEPGGGGKLDYHRFLKGDGLIDRWRRGLTIRAIGFKYRRLKSSSLQSLERGRPTEIDYLNGYICQKGAGLGVPTPVNLALVAMVKQIEAGQRKIAPANLGDPALATAGR
ncbi:MAG: 2-dehydropantoate 2-reductase [Desulfarculus sp.]|nr:2-dehydropantoate 2-reductase [Desulfarculus sp.]